MTPDQARALQSVPELVAAAADDLATATALRRSWPADLVAAATEQAALRPAAAGVFPEGTDLTRLLLTRDGLEQATAAVVAAHRARRYADVAGLVMDLCCGIGGDLAALVRARPTGGLVGVDRSELHAVCAHRNTGVPVVVASAGDIRLAGAGAVYVDPARRAGGHRGGSDPSLAWCLSLPVDRIGVKAAPGLPRSAVPAGWETEFVAVGRSLKEAALWSPAWATAAHRATVLASSGQTASCHTLVADTAVDRPQVAAPGAYLLDPNPAVTRAGAVADLADMVGGWQIDEQIAFLSADQPMSTPFGRSLRVEASQPFGVKALAAELRRLDVGSIEIRRRGLAGDVEDLRRRLRPTGSRRATVVITRHRDRPWALVATDFPGGPATARSATPGLTGPGPTGS